MDLKRTAPLGLFFWGICSLASPVMAVAAPRFTLDPASSSVVVGQAFSVLMGVDSETEKVIGIDVAASFDAGKLSVESIEKVEPPAGGYNSTYTPDNAIIHNDTGKFELTLPSADSSVYTGVVAKHNLLKINFKAKSTGTATLNFTCTAGLVTESNIISDKGVDVIDCATNQSGAYTIAAGAGGESTPETTVAPTATPRPSELPRTGGVGPTVGLMVFGVMAVVAAWFLRFI